MWREITFNSRRMKNKRKYLRNKTTKQEELLWKMIRNNQLGVKFKRQYSIGPYIVDFYSSEKKLILELDGGQHQKLDIKEYDYYRTKYFQSLGQTVLRFKNSEVETEIDKVLDKISNYISALS